MLSKGTASGCEYNVGPGDEILSCYTGNTGRRGCLVNDDAGGHGCSLLVNLVWVDLALRNAPAAEREVGVDRVIQVTHESKGQI